MKKLAWWLAGADAVFAEVRHKSLPEPNIDFAIATLGVAETMREIVYNLKITGGGTGLTYQPNAVYCIQPPGTTPPASS